MTNHLNWGHCVVLIFVCALTDCSDFFLFFIVDYNDCCHCDHFKALCTLMAGMIVFSKLFLNEERVVICLYCVFI